MYTGVINIFNRIATLIGMLLLLTTTAIADERYVLRYDAPAKDNLLRKVKTKGKAKKQLGYIQTALPMGNGRLGAMFSGGIDTEHLLINDITLWMNAKRGMDKVAQSGTRIGANKNLETVRKAYRDGKYGTKAGSMESLATEHLSSTEPLGNYAPFSDLLISSGHDPASVSDYQRTLDSRTGLGTVSYSMGGGRFTREFFCSHPHDVVVARYTASGDGSEGKNAKLNLTIATTTKHKKTKLTASDNRIVLTGEVKMVQDNIEFMQIVTVDAEDGSVQSQDDGSIKVTDATDVVIMLAGYTD